jgi:hypothetical protein
MISAATQSTAKTIPGQRYMLMILNFTMEIVTPHVRYAGPAGDFITPLTAENSAETFGWGESEIKYITFTAWADSIELFTTTQFIFWQLTPISA